MFQEVREIVGKPREACWGAYKGQGLERDEQPTTQQSLPTDD